MHIYKPITLESTIDKVLESIIAELISYLTEAHELLPRQHYSGRLDRITEDTIIVLTENIYAAQKKRKVFSALFIDIADAFNNVHHERLIYNIRKRRILQQITKQVQSFLSGKSTHLHFNRITSNAFPTPAGISQGSPLSPILYTYYNSDLLNIP